MEEMEVFEEIKEKVGKTEIANLIEENDKDEADAIMSYNHLLEAVRNSELSRSEQEIIESEIYEIIGDELNHQERLKMLYSVVTKIKENKD